MKTTNWIIRILILALLASGLVACDEKSRRGRKSPFNRPGQTDSDGSKSQGGDSKGEENKSLEEQLGMGTSFTGGGTGVAGKVYEAYGVRLADLEAFNQILLPKFKAIQDSKENTGDVTFIIPFLMSAKPMYIAPVDLKKVDDDLLGLPFLGTEQDQLARQSLQEIWINKEKFEAKDLEAQAVLILHELVMAEYMMKFLTIDQICKFLNLRGTVFDSETNERQLGCPPETLEHLRSFYEAPEPARHLNAEDNLNIRRVTNTIMNLSDSQPIRLQDLQQLFYENGFDKRLKNFNEENSNDHDDDHTNTTAEDVLTALERANQPNNSLRNCLNEDGTSYSDCSTQIEFDQFSSHLGVSQLTLDSVRIKNLWEGDLRATEILAPTTSYEDDNNDSDSRLLLSKAGGLYYRVNTPVYTGLEDSSRFEYLTIFLFSNDSRADQNGSDLNNLVLEHIILVPHYLFKSEKVEDVFESAEGEENTHIRYSCESSFNLDSEEFQYSLQVISRKKTAPKQAVYALVEHVVQSDFSKICIIKSEN